MKALAAFRAWFLYVGLAQMRCGGGGGGAEESVAGETPDTGWRSTEGASSGKNWQVFYTQQR